MRYQTALLVSLCLAASAAPVCGDVVDSGANGFTVKSTVEITSPAAEVYRAIGRIASWWGSAHTWSGNAANLSLELAPGGCFCEKLPGGGVRHMTVVYVDAGKLVRLQGSLGPMQAMALTASMTLAISEVGGRSKVELTYAAGGYVPGGAEGLSKPVNGVLTEQLERLKQLIETGKADLPK